MVSNDYALSEEERIRRNKRSRRKAAGSKWLIIGAFLLIPLCLLVLLTYYPLGDMIHFSMVHWRRGSSDPEVFVAFGLSSLYPDNYVKFFSNEEYWGVLKVSLFYLLGSFVQIALALFYAVIFYWRPKGVKFFKGIMFLPSLLNGVAIGLMFNLIFNPIESGGALNVLLSGSGNETVDFFGTNLFLANSILTFISVWRYMGKDMVMFAGSMESIPSDIFEAASVDGANKWQQFTHIILPGIKNIVFLNLILAVNGALQVYEIPYIMQPRNVLTQTFIMQTIDISITNNDIGLGSAMGVVLLMMVGIITLIQKLFERRMD